MRTPTTLSKNTLDDILSHYAIGKAVNIEAISGGLANRNFKLTTTEGIFLLKICDEKTVDALKLQVDVLEHLRKYRYPTAYPIRKKNGTVILFMPIGHIILYDFLSGCQPEISTTVIGHIAQALARLHQIPPIANLPRFSMGMSAMSAFLKEVRSTSIDNHPFIGWLKDQIWTRFDGCPPDLPTGMLHGDLFTDNLLFDGEQLIGVIDFEEICYDNLLLDIGMTIAGCCYDDQNRLNHHWVQNFLEHYHRARPIKALEWEMLDQFVRYAMLSLAFWRFRQFNVRHPDTNLKDKHQEMVDRIERWEPIRFSSVVG